MWTLAVAVIALSSLHGALSNSPPIFDAITAQSVPEDTNISSILFNISAFDNDGNDLIFLSTHPATDALVYLQHSGNVGGNRYQTSVILKTALDRDFESATRNLVFYVHDNVYTSTTTVLMIITDVNDEAPKWEEPGYRVTVKESVNIGHQVGVVKANDPDSALGGKVYYGLEASGQSPGDYMRTFTIETILDTGYIHVNESLDYETRTFYQYTMKAWDYDPNEANAGNHADPVDYFITVLDVQDTPPFFRNLPYIKTIDENVTIGTAVMEILAIDGDLGVPNKIFYSFVEGNSDSDNFTIGRDNGHITTSQLMDADSTDMKLKGGVLSFLVNASEEVVPGQEQLGDTSDTSTTTLVTINIRDINDNRPTFSTPLINASVYENTPIGVPLTHVPVEVEDIDMISKNNLFNLSVELNGSPYLDFDTIPGRNQPVSQTNIMIRVNNSTLLDYEERTKVTFQIVAHEYQSEERHSTTVEVVVNIINVNDHSPVFEKSTYHFNISENAKVNDVVGQVVATDADIGSFGEVSYHMEDGDAYFNISKLDGSITVAKNLSREAISSHSLLVRAYDNDDIGQRTGQTRVEISIDDVNDNAPVFVGNVLTIPLVEDIANGTVVTTLSAIDADEGINAEVEYFMFNDHNATGRFAVDASAGTVTIIQSLIGFAGVRVITVEARDKGQPPLSDHQDLVFSVRDVNLHAPNFTKPAGDFTAVNRSEVSVLEEQPVSSTVFMFVATDNDGGLNGKISYGIEPGPDSGFFQINHDTGNLTNAGRLDRENEQRPISDRDNYKITVYAQDGGQPSLRTTLPVLVRLLDIDDNDPYFPRPTKSINVVEESTGCSGAHVDFADDKDEWKNNTVRYYYIQGGDQDHTQRLDLNKSSGVVCVTHKLDREDKAMFNVLVKVSKDSSLTPTPDRPFNSPCNGSDTSLLCVEVHVLDINDNGPVFSSNGKLSTGILYDTAVGEVIYDLREEVTDADEGSNAVTYFNDLGQTGSDIDNVGQNAFTVFPNGSIITNRLFSSTMLGYIDILVEGYDANFTARASLKIYIISNIQRVKIIFNKQPDEVRQIREAFKRELEEHLDYTIVIEKIASHQLPDKSTVDGRTDMFIHAVYDNGELVPATELWKAFDFTQGIALVFSKYGVTETSPVIDQEKNDDDLSRKLTMGLVLVAIVLSIIALSLGISLYCIRQKYARRLRAERTPAVNYYEKDPAPPGTNLYTASNPVFMKQEKHFDEGDTASIDLDDLDDNAVDSGGQGNMLDEQEMTINIDGPDVLRTMNKGSALDELLRYAENEKAKREDRHNLIDDNISDGDSGTFTSAKDLEQSDI